ncbi:hypothetical protein D3C72_993390 [compost metagenome]
MGDNPADWNTCLGIQQRDHCIKHRTADVFIINIDALRAGGGQLLSEVWGSVIDTGIEAQLFHHIAAFLFTASHADYPTAFQFGDLTDDRTDGTAGGGDHQGFTGFRLADLQQPHVSGEARHAQDAKQTRRMRLMRAEVT